MVEGFVLISKNLYALGKGHSIASVLFCFVWWEWSCRSGFDAIDSKEKISARLSSSNGTKLYIKLPWHRHFANGMEVTNGTSQGSANLIGVMFGEGGMMASEFEVDLPLEQKPSRVISSPTLIYSQNGRGPVFAHFELGESSWDKIRTMIEVQKKGESIHDLSPSAAPNRCVHVL